jgi:hypothetical protein
MCLRSSKRNKAVKKNGAQKGEMTNQHDALKVKIYYCYCTFTKNQPP